MTSQLMKLYRKTNIAKEKIINYIVPIVIIDVELASWLKKDLKFCFFISKARTVSFKYFSN